MASVLLLNLGAPSRPEQIYPFLRNLFSDPMIIELPGGRLIQPLLARLIAALRTPKVREYYGRIGGGSPLLSLTREQARSLVRELDHRGHKDVRVEVVMRYLPPDAAGVLSALQRAGEKRAVVLPLYPQECLATTGSSYADLERARDRVAPELELLPIRSFHLHPGYIVALADRIRECLSNLPAVERDDAVLLFSAHGVPETLPRRGDPYVEQINQTLQAVLAELGLDNEHRLAFQSRTGPVKWVGPGTEEVIRELAGRPTVVVIPIAFVSDHIETLYEIDILFAEEAQKAGIGRFVRVASLNTSAVFIKALADLVEPLLQQD
jgi:ferrochelatase